MRKISRREGKAIGGQRVRRRISTAFNARFSRRAGVGLDKSGRRVYFQRCSAGARPLRTIHLRSFLQKNPPLFCPFNDLLSLQSPTVFAIKFGFAARAHSAEPGNRPRPLFRCNLGDFHSSDARGYRFRIAEHVRTQERAPRTIERPK